MLDDGTEKGLSVIASHHSSTIVAAINRIKALCYFVRVSEREREKFQGPREGVNHGEDFDISITVFERHLDNID